MVRIDRTARLAASPREQSAARLRPLCSGARWMASFRGECSHEGHSSLRPEDFARGELFYNSTGCWV